MNFRELQAISPSDYCYDLREQLKDHIYRRSDAAFAAGDAARDALRTPADLGRRQRWVRRRFIATLGGLPPLHTPLNSRVTGEVRGDGFRVEKVIFESRPRVYVTANLYLPDGLQLPSAAVLFLSGHTPEARMSPDYQILVQCLVQAGLIVLAQDAIGQGERFSYYEPASRTTSVLCGATEHQYVGAQCEAMGDSLARYFVHDALRGVDYLRSRPEVDPRRIGCTGASGGGLQTCMMMVADPRIAAASPGLFVTNRRALMYSGAAADEEQVFPNLTAWGIDHEDFLLMMCPKPVCVLAVTSDIGPIEGTRRTVERCRRFWKMCGRPNALRLVEDDSVHAYTPYENRVRAEFLSEYLLGREVSPDLAKITLFEPAQLRCTSSGQVRGEMPGARFVFEENRDRLAQQRHRRGAALNWLRRQVTRERRPCALNPRFYWTEKCGRLNVQFAIWWSQEGLFNHGILFRAAKLAGRPAPVTLAVWDEGGLALQAHAEWIRRTCASGRAVLVFEVTGVGTIAPHPTTKLYRPQEPFGVNQKFHHDLLWLGDSLAALRTYDLLRALDMIESWPNLEAGDIQIYASGKQGIYAQLAAALDRRIARLTVAGGLGSYARLCRSRHYDNHDILSVILPGALKHFDLPDLRAQPRHRR